MCSALSASPARSSQASPILLRRSGTSPRDSASPFLSISRQPLPPFSRTTSRRPRPTRPCAPGPWAVAAGVPMLLEKPIAERGRRGEAVDAAEAAGVPILVGHHRRHSPLIAAARDMIAAGDLAGSRQ